MKRSKKILAMLMSLCMLMSLLPVVAGADSPSTARTTPLDLTGTAWQTGCAQDGTVWTNSSENWSYNTETKTLTLSGATIDCSGTTTCGYAINLPADATVFLAQGTDNTVKGGYETRTPKDGSGSDRQESTAICAGADHVDSFTILGNGTLHAYGADLTPLSSQDGESAGLTNTVIGNDTYAPTVSAQGGNVTLPSNAPKGCWAISYGALTITVNNGAVTLKGGSVSGGEEPDSEGANTVSVTGGSLTAIGGDAAFSIGCDTLESITGGTVYLAGKLETTDSVENQLDTAATLKGSTDYYADPATAALSAAYQESYNSLNFYTSATTMNISTLAKTVRISFGANVAFYTFGGAFADKSTRTVVTADNGTVTLPAQPTWRSSYTFAGWYTQDLTLWADASATTMSGVTENMSVFAMWKNSSGKFVWPESEDFSSGTRAAKDFSLPDYGVDYYTNGATVDGIAYAGKVFVLSGITLDTTDYYGAIIPDGSTVVLKAGTVNTIKCDSGNYSIALECYTEGDHSNGLTIAGTGTLNLVAGPATEADSGYNSLGLYSEGSITIKDGTIYAIGGDSKNNTAGISSGYGSVTIDNGTVTAVGGDSSVDDAFAGSAGISAATDITVNGGKILASGGTVDDGTSIGMVAGVSEAGTGNITFNGGAIKASGEAMAVLARNGAVTIAPSLAIIDPVGAVINNEGGTIFKADGNFATEVIIRAPFTDVPADYWAYSYVYFCYSNDLFQGISPTEFGPDVVMTRGMLVTVLWRLANEPAPSAASTFKDVAAGMYYSDAVAWAAEKGIILGYGDGNCGPNDPVTREQMAAILYRFIKWAGLSVSVGEDTNILSYTDAGSISEYAIPAMQWACGTGMLQGYNNTLMPRDGATRAQVAAVLVRMFQTFAE